MTEILASVFVKMVSSITSPAYTESYWTSYIELARQFVGGLLIPGKEKNHENKKAIGKRHNLTEKIKIKYGHGKKRGTE